MWKKKNQRNCVKQTEVLNAKKSFGAIEPIVNLINIDINDFDEISTDEKSEMIVVFRNSEFSMKIIFAAIQIAQTEFEKTKKTKNRIMNKMIEKKNKKQKLFVSKNLRQNE